MTAREYRLLLSPEDEARVRSLLPHLPAAPSEPKAPAPAPRRSRWLPWLVALVLAAGALALAAYSLFPTLSSWSYP